MAREYLVLHSDCPVCSHPFMENVKREARKLGIRVVLCKPGSRKRVCRVVRAFPAIVRRRNGGYEEVVTGANRIISYLVSKSLVRRLDGVAWEWM